MCFPASFLSRIHKRGDLDLAPLFLWVFIPVSVKAISKTPCRALWYKPVIPAPG